MEHTFSTPSPIRLLVDIGKGSVELTAADVDETRLEITGSGAQDVEVEQEGDEIRVVAPRVRVGFFREDPQVHVRGVVPAHSDGAIRTGSADVSTSGSWANARLRTGSGDLEVELVEHELEIELGSGDITVADAGAEARIKSGSGDVVVRRCGDLVLSTGSGDVRIDQPAGTVIAKTGSGDVHVGEAVGDVEFSTGSGDLTVGLMRRGSLRVRGASGDVAIGIPAGTPVWTDLTTITGRVRSTLEPVGAPREGQDHVEVRASTASGDITLEQR